MRRTALLALAGALGCARLLPMSMVPLSAECPGALGPVEVLAPDRAVQLLYRRVDADGETALRGVAERDGDAIVLVAVDPLGTHVFTVVQRGDQARVREHLRPLFPHSPVDVLRDLHRVGFHPGGPFELHHEACGYDAFVAID